MKNIALLLAALCLLAACDKREAAPVDESFQINCFVEAEVGLMGDEVGVYALDSQGELYFCGEDGDMEVLAEGIRDFSEADSRLYLLTEEGKLLCRDWMDGGKESLLYENEEAVALSDTVLILSDSNLLHYHFDSDSWNKLEQKGDMVEADYWGAAILDGEGTLWYLDRLTEDVEKIAEDVIYCSYSHRNKVYLSDDLWYITADHKLYRRSGVGPYTLEEVEAPADLQSVTAHMGQALLGLEDGRYRSGDGSWETDPQCLFADLSGGSYAVIDKNGRIHFGSLNGGEEVIFAHPDF